jgi:hypothetical protein
MSGTRQPSYIITPQGLQLLKDNYTDDEFNAILSDITVQWDKLKWAIGDWLVAGGKRASAKGNNQYSQAKESCYAFAEQVTGKSRDALQSYNAVSEGYQIMRWPKLCWAVHRLVLAVEPSIRFRYMEKFSTAGLNTTQVREELMRVPPTDRRTPVAPAVEVRARKREIRDPVSHRCPECQCVFVPSKATQVAEVQ